MELAKAAFFDTQIDSEWASARYTLSERQRLDEVLSSVGFAKGMKILEPGCGVGRLTEIMARKVGPEGFVLAVDMSKRMAERCSKRMAAFGNTEVMHAAMEDERLRPEGYDLVVCHNVFPHFRDKGAALRKFSTALKEDGGILIFHFLNSAQINDHRRKISRAVLHDTMPSFSEMKALLHSTGMKIHSFCDDDNGYVLDARLCGEPRRTSHGFTGRGAKSNAWVGQRPCPAVLSSRHADRTLGPALDHEGISVGV